MEKLASSFPKLILLTLLALSSCKETSAPHKSQEDNPQLTMSKFTIESYGELGLEWILHSPEALGYLKKNQLRAADIDIDIFEQGKKSTTITANTGILDSRKHLDPTTLGVKADYDLLPGDMYLTGNVVAVSSDGTKLSTDWLRYRKSMGVIETTAPVKVVRQDSITEGTGMEANEDLSVVKIFNQTVTIKENKTNLKKKKGKK